MTYQECEKLVSKYLKDVDLELHYYYINYLYVTSNRNLLPKHESVETLLKKANRFGRHLNFYNPNDEEYKKMGPNVKGYVRVGEKCDTINICGDFKSDFEKIVYHEIHHIMQIDENNLTVGISLNYYLKLINEASTEYVAEVVYNTIHGLEPIEKVYKTEDIFMHTGGKCYSSALSYQYFDNILIKICLLLGVSKDYFVHLNYDYTLGSVTFISQIISKIKEYNHQDKGMKYNIESEEVIDLINDITATFYHIYYNKPKDIDFFYIRDNYNNLYCVSPKDLSMMVDALDIYLFELVIDPSVKKEFIKYVINPELQEKLYNEVTYGIKSLTISKYLEIKSWIS